MYLKCDEDYAGSLARLDVYCMQLLDLMIMRQEIVVPKLLLPFYNNLLQGDMLLVLRHLLPIILYLMDNRI